MRLLLLTLIVIPVCLFAQTKTTQKPAMFKKVFEFKRDSVHYERSFFLRIPKDTLFNRAEDWMRSQRQYFEVLKRAKISFPTYQLLLAKGYIGFTVPYKSEKQTAKTNKPASLTFIYTLRVYLKAEQVVQVMVNEVRIAGNLKLIGLKLPNSDMDTLYIEDYDKVQLALARTNQTKTKVENAALIKSYHLVDERIKKDIYDLMRLLNKDLEQTLTNNLIPTPWSFVSCRVSAFSLP